ncbi:MAG: phosphoglyceromutase [Bacteroidetes bacterium]|nr:phosphoglyceromutase [Bacteroidota bacterium]
MSSVGTNSKQLFAQENQIKKVVIITLDGYRWQELFTGADEKLIGNEQYVSDTTSLKEKFWRDTPEERREALMPFVWNQVEKIGQIHGNREYGSKVNLTNSMWFSYPGYNEILTGEPDDERIDSNSKVLNPNVTILEKLNKSDLYRGKVVAFGSWDVFPYIVNEERSSVYVNAGFEPAKGENLTEIEKFLNRAQPNTPSPWGSVRLDIFTHNYALEYMKRMQPDIIYIAYGETDDFAHDGNYQAYLNSAYSIDQFLEELWSYTQSDPYYRGKTTFILTTDHGRGTDPIDTWRSHGTDIEGADEVWLMAYGVGIEALGEVKDEEQLYTPKVVEMVESLVDY